MVSGNVKIHCLGGCREVGGSAFLIESSKNVMLDYGLKVESSQPPLMTKVPVHGIFPTHPHLDHLGCIPIIHKRNPKSRLYSTGPTFDLGMLLLRDSLKVARIRGTPQRFTPADIINLHKSESKIHYGDTIKLGHDVEVHVWDAGHTPGSCIFVVETKGKRILYTGDFKIEPTRLIHGARFDFKDIDVVIMETTYSSRDHPPRKQMEKELIQEVKNTVGAGGIALLPSFALRAPELLMILDHYNIKYPIYLDGMAKDATAITMRHPEYLSNFKALKKAVERTIPVYSNEERNNALKEPCVIVTTGGCMEGGPIVHYLKKTYANPNNALILNGFQIPGTAGRYLLDTGRFVHGVIDLKIKMKQSLFDLSGHVGRTGLLNFVQKINPKKVLCVHGDYCEKFATELTSRFNVKAMAPKNGDVIRV